MKNTPHHEPPIAGALTWKDVEREGWQRNAPHYDLHAGQMTAKAIAPLLKAVGARPGIRLLDVCCGPGYVAGRAAAQGSSAIGIDLVPEMVREARQRFPAAEFREGDAEKMDFPDAAFDAVTCAFGLLHLSDPAAAFAEAARVLRAEGRYAFTVWCQPEKARLLGLALKAITAHADMSVPLPPAPPMFQFSDPAVAQAALTKAGFSLVAREEVDIEFRGHSPEDVFDCLEKSTVRTMALFRLQTTRIQARIRAAVLEGAELFRKGGEVRIPCPALLYSAVKS